MGRIIRPVSIIAGICAALLFCGCTGENQAQTKRINVGVLCYDQKDTFISELTDTFERYMELYDESMEVMVRVCDAAGMQRTQNDQAEELIGAQCDVLCVNLVEREEPSEIIDMARDRNVPIVFFNREPVEEDMMQWDRLFYLGADARESGRMQGELAAEYIKNHPEADKNKDGRIQYVVLEGEPGHQDAILRTESVVETLKDEEISLQKLGCGIANWRRAQAENRMMQMIGQYRGGIELVLANNDDMALGAIDAYNKLNYTQESRPVFFGVDGTRDGLKAVIDGTIAGTVYNDKELQARVMADLCYDLATGSSTEDIKYMDGKYIYIPYQKVTAENVSEFYRKY